MSSGYNIVISTHNIREMSLVWLLYLLVNLLFATTFLSQTMKPLPVPFFLIFLPNLKAFQTQVEECLSKSELNYRESF